MLNIEYYKDKLVELGVIDLSKLAVVHDKPVKCKDLYKCDKCDFGEEESCEPYLEEWLFSEYEEPKVDWSKVEVDTPILVRNNEDKEWVNRYFAKFVDGKVYAWDDGATSWTANDECDVTSWNCVKLAGRSEKNED